MTPFRLAEVLRAAYRVIGQDASEDQRWLAVAFAAIGVLSEPADKKMDGAWIVEGIVEEPWPEDPEHLDERGSEPA